MNCSGKPETKLGSHPSLNYLPRIESNSANCSMVLVDIAGEGGVEDGVELSGLAGVPGVPSPVPPGVIPRA